MRQVSTTFLRIVLILLAGIVFGVCVFALPPLIGSVDLAGYDPILIGMYFPAIPFLIALYQAFQLLGYIDKNIAFSQLSVKALKKIKYCAIAISVMYAAGMPFIFQVADKDDAPGVVAIGLIIIGASVVFAVFAAVLQKLIQSGIEIKSENDLTV